MNDAQTVVKTLRGLGVECSLAGVVEAPQLRRYELVPGPGARMHDFRKVSRSDDLACALGAESVRILAPIPGRKLVGVEVSRKDREIIDQTDLPAAMSPLTAVLGHDIDGRPTLLPIDEAPHVLIAGQTGSGKSSALRVILAGLLESLGPDEMRLCLIDPKRVEMAALEGLPHLLFPTAEDPETALMQLQALAINMDDRYSLLRDLGVRDIAAANELLSDLGAQKLPRFVCVIDELAELMLTSRKEVEAVLVRLAQKARAVGIHLILATQYPKREILTGLLRANLPTRIAFAVPDMTASRLVLDRNGAETLLGKGDGLFSFGGLPPTRFQSAFCSPERMAEVVARCTNPERMEVAG